MEDSEVLFCFVLGFFAPAQKLNEWNIYIFFHSYTVRVVLLTWWLISDCH